jgi:dephospho-CoA kinase
MIIAISGATASGKTTLAKALAERTGGTPASFGDYVRALASEQGRTTDRSTLQAVGQAAVEAGAEAFLAEFLGWTGWTGWTGWPGKELLILDGLRHVSIRDALRAHAERAGTKVRFVHVDTDADDRARRLRARGDDSAAIVDQDAHASERDVKERLRDEADLRIYRTDDIADMSGRVETALGLTFIRAAEYADQSTTKIAPSSRVHS